MRRPGCLQAAGKPNAQTYHLGIILTAKMVIWGIVYGSAYQIARSAMAMNTSPSLKRKSSIYKWLLFHC
jgi:uncharacterized membrane protein